MAFGCPPFQADCALALFGRELPRKVSSSLRAARVSLRNGKSQTKHTHSRTLDQSTVAAREHPTDHPNKGLVVATCGREPETSECFPVVPSGANKRPEKPTVPSIEDDKSNGTPSTRRAVIGSDGRPPLSPDKQASMRDIHKMATTISTKISKTLLKTQVY